MKARMRSTLATLVVLVVLGIGVFLVRPSGGGSLSADGHAGGGAAKGGARMNTPPGASPRAPAGTSSDPAQPEVLAELSWGSGPDQLGRERPQEANPEAPMSLAVDLLGNILVLDQVNGRLVRLGPDGKLIGTLPMTQQTPQDVTLAKDGTALVLDRLRDKTVAIIDPITGKLLGELPVEGKGIPEGGAVTATFVEGDSVYVEREHGALVRIGDTSGRADPERPELNGRPTRDGRFLITTGIIDMDGGRIYLNTIDRQTNQHRYTREYRLQVPVMAITLLDTDLSGTIYLGVMGELPTGKAEPATQVGVRLFCIEPLEGKVLGQADLPANTMPEETFRDFVVSPEGGVIYQLRTDSGISLRRAHCR